MILWALKRLRNLHFLHVTIRILYHCQGDPLLGPGHRSHLCSLEVLRGTSLSWALCSTRSLVGSLVSEEQLISCFFFMSVEV
jgi:hypothetical protein